MLTEYTTLNETKITKKQMQSLTHVNEMTEQNKMTRSPIMLNITTVME